VTQRPPTPNRELSEFPEFPAGSYSDLKLLVPVYGMCFSCWVLKRARSSFRLEAKPKWRAQWFLSYLKVWKTVREAYIILGVHFCNA